MQKHSTTKVQVNNITITFSKKKMTAYGGFSLLAAFFTRIHLRQAIEKIIPIHELSPNSIGIYGKLIGYIAMLFAGADRFSHLLYLGHEEVVAAIFGAKRLPRASTTMTRLFGKLKKLKDVEAVGDILWQYLKDLIPWNTIKEDWLTFDSTVLERYGEQEGAKKGYNPNKHGRPSHHPLIAFLNKSRYVIHLWNRSGNVASWNNIEGFFTSAYERIHNLIKISGVIADSGFYVKQFIELLEEKELTYIIAVKLYRPLQRKVYSITDWKEITKGIWVAEFLFSHPGWKKDRRHIVVRQDIIRRKKAMGKTLPLFKNEYDMQNYRYGVWITNSSESPHDVWNLCKPRANDENTIKELKEDFALGGFSMKHFYSVESAMLIRVLAYNLFLLFRNDIMGQKERTQRLKTLRYKYFVLPGQLGRAGKEPVLRISAFKKKLRSKLIYFFSRISDYIPCSERNCNAVGIA